MIVYGIGYQGKSLDDLVDRLRLAGVEMVVDVRLRAWSRKPGFSKSQLQRRLAEEGMEYTHAPALGNEKENRDGFASTAGRAAKTARDRYRRHLANGSTPAVQELLKQLEDRPAAVLCFEEDERHCHREVLIEHLQELQPKLVALPL